MTFSTIIRKPSAYVPMVLSIAALALVVGYVVTHPQALQAVAEPHDENTPARIFQLLIAIQVPIVAWFAVRWLPRAPKPAVLVLLLQAGAVVSALLPVFLLEM